MHRLPCPARPRPRKNARRVATRGVLSTLILFAYGLPVLKTALAKNPDLLFVASPWSPPAWMKTNGSMLAGKLKPDYYDAFARYLVTFIRAYEAEGVPIDAVTPQNEPDYPNPEYPTTHWTAEEQRRFVRDHLGPLFRREGIETKISTTTCTAIS